VALFFSAFNARPKERRRKKKLKDTAPSTAFAIEKGGKKGKTIAGFFYLSRSLGEKGPKDSWAVIGREHGGQKEEKKKKEKKKKKKKKEEITLLSPHPKKKKKRRKKKDAVQSMKIYQREEREKDDLQAASSLLPSRSLLACCIEKKGKRELPIPGTRRGRKKR